MSELSQEADRVARESVNVIFNVGGKDVTVNEGDVYVFDVPMKTRAGHVHEVGSTLTVLAKTNIPAWGEVSQSKSNWYCETQYGKTIWTTLEQCISRRVMHKMELDGRSSSTPIL